MARGRKAANAATTQTAEDRLKAALVPEEEWPYPLPENWRWVRLKDIAQWGSGGTPSRKNPAYYSGPIPWVKTGELNEAYIWDTEEKISELALANSSAKLFPKNTVLVAMYGATIGKTAILGIEATTNQACACAICHDCITHKFLFYFLKSQQDAFIAKGQGGAQPNISQEIIKKHYIPLPPLPEQQRIVDRIESLFAKLDEAREKAQAALDSFETRRAAILHKAFTGELTAKWREENGVIDKWDNLVLEQISEDVKVGIVIKPSQFYTDKEHGVAAFRSANVRENFINDNDWVYINDEGMRSNKRSIVHTGDVLVVRSGAPGTACVVTDEFNGYNAIDILIIVPKKSKIDAEFLCMYLNSPYGKQKISAKKRGIGLTHFNVKSLSKLSIPTPTTIEQQQVVYFLKAIFKKEQQAKDIAQASLDRIDLIKKAILAKAFRGELGTNDQVKAKVTVEQ